MQTNNLTKAPAKKRTMTKKELSYHETQAGLKAMAAAEGEGATPEAIEAMMEMEEFPVPGTKIVLKRLSLQTVWAMEAVGSAYVNEGDDQKPISAKDIVMGALCYSDPLSAFRLAKAGKINELEEKAFELAGQLDMVVIRQVNDWINAQNARAKKLSGQDDDAGADAGNAQGEKAAPESKA